MFGKGTKVYSIVKSKCPRCHEGEFFVSRKFDLRTIGNVREACSECGLKYEKEPGFYFGAMYVSYALGVAAFVTLWVSFNLFFDNIPIGWQIGSIITAIVVFGPSLSALSKIIYINMFVRYDSEAIQDHKEEKH